jgi:uncharacterized protein (UPF0218 family)
MPPLFFLVKDAKMKNIPKDVLTITPTLRRELKYPLGTLLQGAPEETMNQLRQLIQKEKPKCIISVGDVVSQNMLKQGFQIQIIVVDNKVMREPAKPIKAIMNRRVNVKNPPGTLTPESWEVIEQALKEKQPTQVLVEGEEDLLALVAILEAPENSLVVYGQPHEGVVVIKVDGSMKEKVNRIIQAMVPLPKS